MRVLSLDGAGAVRQHVTHDLGEFSDFSEIVIGDYDLGRAQRLAAEIGDPRLQALQIDAKDYDSLVQLFQGFDVILNGLPWKHDMAVTRACIEAGVSGLEEYNNPSRMPIQRRLCDGSRLKSTPVPRLVAVHRHIGGSRRGGLHLCQ